MFDKLKNYFRTFTNDYKNSQYSAMYFGTLLATIAANIDGELDDSERNMLQDMHSKLMASDIDKINCLTGNNITYSDINQCYKSYALKNEYTVEHNAIIKNMLLNMISADKTQRPEEEILAILCGLMMSGYDNEYEMYVVADEVIREPNHKLFTYLHVDEVIAKFTNTKFKIVKGDIVIRHPFDDNALIPLSKFSPAEYEQELFGGILSVLQILGARKVVITNIQGEENTTSKSVENNKKVEVPVVKIINLKSKSDIKFNIENVMKMSSKEEVCVTFEGASFVDKLTNWLFLNYKLRQYRSNPEYSEIIKLGTSTTNKMKQFEHLVHYSKLTSACHLLDAAQEIGLNIIKKGIEAEAGSQTKIKISNSKSVCSFKNIYVEF